MTQKSDTVERQALTAYVRMHLPHTDMTTLHRMVDLLKAAQPAEGTQPPEFTPAEELEEVPEVQQLNRRSFVRGLAVAGLGGVALAGAGSVVAWGLSGRRTGQALQIFNDKRVNELQGLVDLYEELERVGLDQILTLGLNAVSAIVQVVVLAAKGLRAGLDAVRTILRAVMEAGPALQAALTWAGQVISTLAGQLQNLEHTLQQTLQRAQPITDALGGFVSFVINNLPGPTGERVRQGLAQIGAIMQAIPTFIQDLNTRLIQPLANDWFSADAGKGLTGRLITPLVTQVLDPLDAHLAEVANLEQTWRMQLAEPAQQALAQRQTIRHRITAYRHENNLV